MFENTTVEVEELDLEVEQTQTGLLGSTLGVGASFAVTPSLMLGGSLLFASQGRDVTETSSLMVLPHLRFLLGEGSVVPYLQGTLGYRSVTLTVDGDDDTYAETGFGAGVGLHLFANDNFSIDPALHVFRFGGTREFLQIDVDDAGVPITTNGEITMNSR